MSLPNLINELASTIGGTIEQQRNYGSIWLDSDQPFTWCVVGKMIQWGAIPPFLVVCNQENNICDGYYDKY